MKILEFYKKSALKPVGGPAGYLHGLYTCDKSNQLSFINDRGSEIKSETKIQQGVKSALIRCVWYSKILFWGKTRSDVCLEDYDIIHFHTTLDLFNYRKLLKNYTGIVALTSHSPTLLSIEMHQKASKWEKIIFYPLYKALKKMDTGAFQLADIIVFPCEEAEEPYVNAWKGFRRFKQKHRDKFRYLLSGTFQRTAAKSRKEICAENHIPEDAFIISFVGRHNEIKGYDLLKEMAMNILGKHDNVYFLIAGNEEPLKGVNHPRWIEIGWTSDPHSYIAASDLFVLPNRETYFDLVMLEVLSLGKIVLASRTGGNRYFDNDKYPGIILYGNQEDAIAKIESLMCAQIDERTKLEQSNYNAFVSEFESEIFYNNYMDLMNRIFEERAK